MAVSDPAADHDSATARDLVEIKGAVAVQYAEMDRILGLLGQRLQARTGDLDEVCLLLRLETELEQLRPELVAAAGGQRQIAALDTLIAPNMPPPASRMGAATQRIWSSFSSRS